jgi:hypothetical protein
MKGILLIHILRVNVQVMLILYQDSLLSHLGANASNLMYYLLLKELIMNRQDSANQIKVVLHLPNDVLHLLYIFNITLIKDKDVMLNHKSLKSGFHHKRLVIFTLK